MATLGLENVYYAKLTKDDKTGVTYSAPKPLRGAVSIQEQKTINTAKLYADNRLWASRQVFSEGSVTLEFADVALEDYADLCGHTIDSNGKLIESASDVAPYVCIMGEGLKEDGETKRYFKLLKGQCSENQFNVRTAGESPEFTVPQFTATFMPRQNDGRYKYVIDSTADNAAYVAKWYNSVEDT